MEGEPNEAVKDVEESLTCIVTPCSDCRCASFTADYLDRGKFNGVGGIFPDCLSRPECAQFVSCFGGGKCQRQPFL